MSRFFILGRPSSRACTGGIPEPERWKAGGMLEHTVSSATQTALEFPSLLRVIACLATTDLGAEQLVELQPFTSPEALQRHRRLLQDAQRLHVGHPLLPYCERPFGPLLEALEGSGQTVTGRDLVDVARLLTMAADAAERVRQSEPPCEALGELAEALPSTAELRRVLKKTFDGRGEIREDATPRLAEIKGKLRRVRQRVYSLLKTSLDAHQDDLEDTIPMRGGRLVLMLRSGSRGRLQGLVHGRSGSGRSFYFEPLAAVEENNQLQQTSEEEEAEKRRILADIVRRLREAWPDIEAQVEWVKLLDHLQASVRFADTCGGRLAEMAPRHDLRLVGGRHPLIDPALASLRREALGTEGHQDAIVPLDLELSADTRALVVTGPNAGGKTVALKTLGLLALIHQCGLPIPAAAGTRLPFFESIVATVGDDQDLLADRSTFSGRLLRLKEVWEAASEDALVLLDELGSGTDPDEGAALSTAILESLIERQSLVFVTTHLGQVAAAALENDGAHCAAMLFDSRTGRPTYRLLPGPPGGSEALALARRLGLPGQWLERAEALLGSEHRELRRLLTEVEASRRQLAETQARLDEELADAETLRQRQAELESDLRRQRKTLGRDLKRQLEDFRQQTQRALNDEVEALRRATQEVRAQPKSSKASAKMPPKRTQAAETTARLFAEAPVFSPQETAEEVEIQVGGTVQHRRLGWKGVLEKLERGKAQVRVQGKLLRCKEGDLAGVGGQASSGPSSDRGSKTSRLETIHRESRQRSWQPEAQGAQQIDLIGQRVEPALEQLDHFVDQALMASYGTVRVVHGHGTGRLRKAVRDFLKRHRAVASIRPGKANEGGNGATIAQLAE